jgi:RNA polymerase-interacting CarD/CdnL/TRCF family regulator
MAASETYAPGDWIVHAHYGVGRIEGIETKNISGEDTRYYRVITNESTFWVPVDQMDSELIRPLSSIADIEDVIAALQKPAKVMSSNAKVRQSRIHKVRMGNEPVDIARLIRDLKARQRDKGILYATERSAFITLKQQLVREWAIVTDTETEAITAEIDGLLEHSHVPDNND